MRMIQISWGISVFNQQMNEIYGLIRQKRFDEARKVLQTVDDSVAKDWLQYLDRIDPPTVEAPRVKPTVQSMNAKMAEAYKLIRAKHYAEARALLITIDHLTAKRWLQHLEKIAPQDKVTDQCTE